MASRTFNRARIACRDGDHAFAEGESGHEGLHGGLEAHAQGESCDGVLGTGA